MSVHSPSSPHPTTTTTPPPRLRPIRVRHSSTSQLTHNIEPGNMCPSPLQRDVGHLILAQGREIEGRSEGGGPGQMVHREKLSLLLPLLYHTQQALPFVNRNDKDHTNEDQTTSDRLRMPHNKGWATQIDHIDVASTTSTWIRK